MRELFTEPRVEELPQREQREEIGALVAKAQVRLVGRLLLLERPLARIGHRQRARDHQHLGEAAALARGEDHPADARVDRQPGELAAERGERAGGVDRAQLLQQLVPVGDRARPGRLEERKRLDVAQVERRHAQDHRRERRAQDFRLGVGGARREVVLAVEADAHTCSHAAAAPGPLARRRLRDLLDLQQRGLVAHRVALDAREPGVDHVADSRHRERRLRRRWSRARSGGRRRARTPAAAPAPTAARRAAGSRPAARTGAARGPCGSSSAVSRISRSPGRKTRMSPGPSRHRSSAAATIASSSSSSSSASSPPVFSGRWRTSTGHARPETSITGALCSTPPASRPKCRAKRPASRVADVTITLRSGRCGSSCLR